MDLAELERGAEQGRLACVRAYTLLHGCVRLSEEGDGWMRPCRLTEGQARAIGSCQAWHPGLFRQMARATSGVVLEFDTDASEVAFELYVDREPPATRTVLNDVDAWEVRMRQASEEGPQGEGGEGERQGGPRPHETAAPLGRPHAALRSAVPHPIAGTHENPHDALVAEIDDRSVTLPLPLTGPQLIALPLDDPSLRPRPDTLQLPGLGTRHHVRLWLPALRGCAVRRLWGNGSAIEPVPERLQLLVLGDSLAQGFATGSAAASWPALLAGRMGLDLLNQGIGGQVFQPGTLHGLQALVSPAAIVIAFGANYRYEPCRPRVVATEVRAYLAEVARLWPEVPTWVATPTWHDEEASPSHDKSCWEAVPSMIAANVAAHDEMRLVDGAMLLDAEATLLADGYEHLNAEGAAQVAHRLYLAMRRPDEADATGVRAMRERALAALAAGPATTFPLAETLRRGKGRVEVAEEGCVLVSLPDDEQMLWATDVALAAAAMATYVTGDTLDLHSPALADKLAVRHGLTCSEPYHLAIYEGNEPPHVDANRDVRVLDASFLPQVMERYSHPEWLLEEQVRARLEAGRFLGGFEDGELVGFIGEHVDGALGLLEVFVGHRRKGWATALEVAQIARALERGEVPWLQVFPHNRASLRLQRKLGLRITPASEQAFLSHEGINGS